MSDYCCTEIKYAIDNFDLPFCEPLYVEKDTMDLKVAGPSLKLKKLTKAGKISQRGGMVVACRFCPFCGTRLMEEEE